MKIIRPLLKRMQNGNSWEKGRRKKGIIQQSGTIKICAKVYLNKQALPKTEKEAQETIVS